MYRVRSITAGALLLVLGLAPPLKAQQGSPGQAGKPEREKSPVAPGQQQPRKGKTARRQAGHSTQGAQSDQSKQPAHGEESQRPPQAQRVEPDQQRGVWQGRRAHSWTAEHRNWRRRGGYSGYHIPDLRFHSFFGPDHWFRISDQPIELVGRYPRFQYGTYWFMVVDPLPESWSDDWYESDDVYVEYSDDGYYLYNRSHPDLRVAISIHLN